MRKALDKIGELYFTSQVFQDLLETGGYTAAGAIGQAITTDMTPEEIALSGAAMFAGGMAGRPIGGAVGQRLGKYVDTNHPAVGEEILEGIDMVRNNMTPTLRKLYDAKIGPIAHLGGAQQYGNIVGRGVGDNVAQLGIALAAPGLINIEEEA